MRSNIDTRQLPKMKTLQQCGDDLNRGGHNYSVRGRLIAAYTASTLTASAYNSTMRRRGGGGDNDDGMAAMMLITLVFV